LVATSGPALVEFSVVTRFSLTWAASAVLLGGGVAYAQTIDSCQSSVGPHETGVLVADLTCSADSAGITILDRGTLDMQGHTLTRTTDGSGFSWRQGIRCVGFCTITSTTPQRGKIIGNSDPESIGIALDGTRARVSNVEISGFQLGISYPLPITEPPRKRLHIEGVTISAIESATRVFKVRGADINIGPTQRGIGGRVVKLDRLTCNGPTEYCVSGGKVRLREPDLTGATDGVRAARLIASDGSIVGNSVDLLTVKQPKLSNLMCDKSAQYDAPTESWGVCALD